MSVIKIPIGDWSKDGHNQCDILEYESNYPVQQLQQAYKDSCKLTGLQFNHGDDDYTGIIPDWNSPRIICAEYEDSELSSLAQMILKDHGCDLDEILANGQYLEVDSFTSLLLWFIGLSMPTDWICERIVSEGEYLNGFWNNNLNVQFGYGLFN